MSTRAGDEHKSVRPSCASAAVAAPAWREWGVGVSTKRGAILASGRGPRGGQWPSPRARFRGNVHCVVDKRGESRPPKTKPVLDAVFLCSRDCSPARPSSYTRVTFSHGSNTLHCLHRGVSTPRPPTSQTSTYRIGYQTSRRTHGCTGHGPWQWLRRATSSGCRWLSARPSVGVAEAMSHPRARQPSL